MTNDSHETALTQFLDAGGVRFAYRRFGKRGGTPLLLNQYFAASMDDWDPKITNGLAADNDVILFNNAGVASSGGESPSTVLEMTKHCFEFCRALDLRELNVVGFSLGGMIAQQLALDHPKMVKRMILLGTGPRGGENMTFPDLSIKELEDPLALLMGAFFTPSANSQAAGRAYVERLQSRKTNRDLPVSLKTADAQIRAIQEWGTIPARDRYATLPQIKAPTLVVHGNMDTVVVPINAFILQQHLPNAQLIIYPDANHASQSQHADVFLKHAQTFLDA